MNQPSLTAILSLLLVLSTVGCGGSGNDQTHGSGSLGSAASPGSGGSGGSGGSPALSFTDVTTQAGIRFRHNSGAFGRKYLPETMGSGAAFLDADGDGWQDIFLVNSMNWPGHPGSRSFSSLYRNNGNGTFTEITREAGLQVQL